MKSKTVILNIVCFFLIAYSVMLSISFDLCILSDNNSSVVYLIMSTVSSFEYGMVTVFLGIVSEIIFLFEAVLFNKYFIHAVPKIWKYIFLTVSVIGFIFTLNFGYLLIMIESV